MRTSSGDAAQTTTAAAASRKTLRNIAKFCMRYSPLDGLFYTWCGLILETTWFDLFEMVGLFQDARDDNKTRQSNSSVAWEKYKI